jgi:hypothetical protein
MVARTEKVKDRVRRILQEYPPTRGDDCQLLFRYLRRYHPDIRFSPKQFEALLYMPSPETLTRRRREIQIALPDLRPTERTVKKRARNEHAYHGYYGKGMALSDFEVD